MPPQAAREGPTPTRPQPEGRRWHMSRAHLHLQCRSGGTPGEDGCRHVYVMFTQGAREPWRDMSLQGRYSQSVSLRTWEHAGI